MKSLPQLKQEATAVFNEFIRLRDAGGASHFKCISSGRILPVEYMEAGHYFNTGHYDGLRFDEENVHGQSHFDNCFLYGNFEGYTQGLIDKIGIKRLDALKQRAEYYRMHGYKFTRSELIEIIEKYKQKIKELK